MESKLMYFGSRIKVAEILCFS